jgi:hypothetical protein
MLIQQNENVNMRHQDVCRLWRYKQKYALEIIQNKATLIDGKTRKRYMSIDECYDAYAQAHNLLRHPGRDAMLKNLQSKFANVPSLIFFVFLLVWRALVKKRDRNYAVQLG